MNGLHLHARNWKAGDSVARPTGDQWFIPEDVIIATWRALAPTAAKRVEGTVRWAAPAVLTKGGPRIVTTVLVPQQIVGAGRFELPPEATRMMGDALLEHGLVNVAQVHTHPDRLVGHSPWDDERAYSHRDGALSIVWPCYGEAVPCVDSWGVHTCTSGAWRRLSRAEVAARVAILPSVLDLRISVTMFSHPEEDDQRSVAGAGKGGNHARP